MENLRSNRYRAAAFAVIALSFISCLSPAQQKLQEGDAYFGKQAWDSAIVSYSLAAELDPQLKLQNKIASAYSGKSEESFKNGDYESAVYNFDKAAWYDPQIRAGFDLAYARYRTGLVYFEKGRREDALQMLGAAIDGGYTKPDAYLARAQVYNSLGIFVGAIGDASLCLDLDPQSARAYFERGYACLSSGEYAKAISDLSQAIVLDDTLKGAYFYRGLAFKETGEFRKAIYDLKLAVESGPAATPALLELGRCYYLATDYSAAVEQFTRAIELNSSDVAVAFNDRAVCLGRLGEYNSAVSDLSLLIRLKPAFPLAYYNLGVVYMKMNQPPSGIESLDTYMCLDQTDKYGCRDLAYGWRRHNVEYNLCCSSRNVSDFVLNRCNTLLRDYRGAGTVQHEIDALYFGTDQDRDY